MQTILTLALLTTDRLMVALLGGPEIIGILAVILILYAAGRLPDLLDRLRGSFSESLGAFDEASHDVGKELGGIFGKHASQALTPDNQTAELYDPAALHKEERLRRSFWRVWYRRWRRLWRRVWFWIFRIRI
ncbi:MAG: hypothetical protein KIS67_00175 [Verrucomicrobiae bacterium]|nr:hypothetical protein [Verrucomicrobiae bacterium]